MELAQLKQAMIETPKGSNIVVEWLRACKTRKNVSQAVTKAVRMIGRIGIDYDNQKVVQEKRENGELPSENQGLPWGVWAIFPYLIEHKGTYYLRLYNGTSQIVKPDVHFFIDGVEVSKTDALALCLASEKDSEHGDCFTCKVENITRLNQEAEWIMLANGATGQEKVELPVPAKTLATMI